MLSNSELHLHPIVSRLQQILPHYCVHTERRAVQLYVFARIRLWILNIAVFFVININSFVLCLRQLQTLVRLMQLLFPNWKTGLKGIFVFLCLDPLLLNVYRCTVCLFSRAAYTAEGSISLYLWTSCGCSQISAFVMSHVHRLFYFYILTNGIYWSLAIRSLQQNSNTPNIFSLSSVFQGRSSIIKPVMLMRWVVGLWSLHLLFACQCVRLAAAAKFMKYVWRYAFNCINVLFNDTVNSSDHAALSDRTTGS
jgi:hypothetical protein